MELPILFRPLSMAVLLGWVICTVYLVSWYSCAPYLRIACCAFGRLVLFWTVTWWTGFWFVEVWLVFDNVCNVITIRACQYASKALTYKPRIAIRYWSTKTSRHICFVGTIAIKVSKETKLKLNFSNEFRIFSEIHSKNSFNFNQKYGLIHPVHNNE